MGSGYRTFTAGEVLTASNVQNFLQDQVVMVFADSTARATSIGTANFEEGMVSYLEDSDTVEVYDGSAWGSIAPVSSQGLTLINTTSFSGVASTSLPADTFTSTYDDYKAIVKITAASLDAGILLKMRKLGSDTSSGYYMGGYQVAFTGAAGNTTANNGTSWQIGNVDSSNVGVGNSYEITFYKPKTTQLTNFTLVGWSMETDGTTFWVSKGGVLTGTTEYDAFSIIASAGNIGGTISVYGFNK